MALPPSPHNSPFSKHKQDIKQPAMAQQLLTPEELPLESFDDTRSLPSIRSVVEPSTPESPAFRSFARGASFPQHDEVLYPDHNSPQANGKPLFEQSTSLPSSSVSPALAHGQLTNILRQPSAVTTPVEMYNQGPMIYWRDCMSEIDEMRDERRQRQLPPVQPSNLQKRDSFTSKQLSRLNVNETTTLAPLRTNVTRNAIAAKPKTTHATAAISSGVQKRKRRQPPTIDTRALTPESKPRTRAPATKKKEGPNADSWYEVEDCCPPISSLHETNTTLVLPEWKSNASNPVRSLDLEHDPDREHLDDREVDLASALRLPCNMYLLCKRRIFVAKLHALQEGKEFNKTAAQNVCTIDVNKVSKMWTAFNRVGWFDERWFKKWL